MISERVGALFNSSDRLGNSGNMLRVQAGAGLSPLSTQTVRNWSLVLTWSNLARLVQKYELQGNKSHRRQIYH